MKLYNAIEVTFQPRNHMFPGSGFRYNLIEFIQNSYTIYLHEYYMSHPFYTNTLDSKFRIRIQNCLHWTSAIIMWIMYICFSELTAITIVNSVYLLTGK
jgi:hypothetical protein